MFGPPGRSQTHAGAQPRFIHVDNFRSIVQFFVYGGCRFKVIRETGRNELRISVARVSLRAAIAAQT